MLSCVPTTVRRWKPIKRFGRALIKTSAALPAAKWNRDESVLTSIAIGLIKDATVEMAGWPADVVRMLAEATVEAIYRASSRTRIVGVPDMRESGAALAPRRLAGPRRPIGAFRVHRLRPPSS